LNQTGKLAASGYNAPLMTKGHSPRWLVEQRKQPHRKPHTPPKRKFALDWKFWSGLLIAVIALWLTVEDRPTVSLGPPLDTKNLLSTQIVIVNNGVLAINDVSFAIYVRSCKLKGGPETDFVAIEDYQPPTKTLQPGEPVTTNFNVIVGNSSLGRGIRLVGGYDAPEFLKFDIALIASFRPTWAPFWTRTKAFRFTAVPTSGGMMMQQVPAEDIESEYRKQFHP